MTKFIHRTVTSVAVPCAPLVAALLLAVGALTMPTAHAVPLPIVNHSFETDPNNFNEFFLGTPTGWSLIDDNSIIDGGGNVPGTLTATGSAFFNSGAPDGDNVAILYISSARGLGEVGLGQVLGDTLAANTTYTLDVEVGNIQSGNASNAAFFDLSGFPGYRIELRAGGTLLAALTEGIVTAIPEGEFEARQLVFTSNASHAGLLGQDLEIRLFNLNLTDAAFPGADLEVDFDNIRLDATLALAEPSGLVLMLLGLAGLGFVALRRRH